jgi:hypothetical protein
MELVYFTLWFMVTAATIWDMRRTQLQSQAIQLQSQEIIREIHASAERIAQMTAEVLRRTPER